MKFPSATLVLIAAAALPRLASAAGPADKTAAESLFVDAKQLMQQNRFAEACPKLEASQKLDPGVGTLLNLALCYKSAGRTASAWAAYRESAAAARAAGEAERESIARDESSALEPKLSRLTIQIAPDLAALNPKVLCDGNELPPSMWGSGAPVDPGNHVVDVSAPGKKPWRGEVTIGAEADSQTVAVPALEDAPQAAVPVAASAALPPPAGASAPEAGDSNPPVDEGAPKRRLIGFVSASVGAAALGVGTYFGIHSLSLKSESDDHCDASGCDPTGLSKYSDAKSAALIADVGVGAGLVCVGVGAYLVFTNGGLNFGGPPARADHAHLPFQVTPIVGSRVGGLRVGTSF